MRAKAIIFALLLTSALFAAPTFAQEPRSFGILENNIWYSKEPFFVGETITIYSAIFNVDNEDIEGSVDFFDNETLIGKSDFRVNKNEGLTQVKIDWLVTEGSHSLVARLNEAHIAGDFEAKVIAQNQKTGEAVFSVDFDTDKDGIGDLEDEDDDGDGLSDSEELNLGTDPKNPDSDGDGLNDKQEQEAKSNPLNSDSDGDGLKDGEDLAPTQVSEQRVEVSEDKEPLITREKAIAQSKETGQRILSAVNTFADKQEERLGKVKRSVQGQINEIKSGREEATTGKSVLLRAYLLLLSILEFIFRVKWLFYLALIFVAYKLLKWLFRKIFRRRLADLD